jgi:hypothetical protein
MMEIAVAMVRDVVPVADREVLPMVASGDPEVDKEEAHGHLQDRADNPPFIVICLSSILRYRYECPDSRR